MTLTNFKMKSCILSLLCICAAVPSLAATATGIDTTQMSLSDSLSSLQQENTLQDAFATALRYTGVDTSAGMLVVSQPILDTIEFDDTPLLWKRMNGQVAWRIRVKNVPLTHLASKGVPAEEIDIDFDVFVSMDGQTLIKIESIAKQHDIVKSLSKTRLQAIDSSLTATGYDVADFSKASSCSFVEILKDCPTSIWKAKKFRAMYVIDDFEKRQPRQVRRWHIYMWGIPPVPSFGDPSLVNTSVLYTGGGVDCRITGARYPAPQ